MIGILIALASLSVPAQILTYTENESGADKIPLGYPVPLPVDSLTPVDGFRTYSSLSLRHQQLTEQSENIEQHQIGSTVEQRPIWAYLISDKNDVTLNGLSEGAALINGTIHAREWQSPEVLTSHMETLFERQNDNYIGQFLHENMRMVMIPVLNVDGFLQTQRYPSQVTSNAETPRDGRMRRKNMREVDTLLTTPNDNQKGIDLNRNNNPYWATSNNSSSDIDSLVYHGTAPASEPETKALQQAAKLAGEDRLRFYIDTHSFTQVYLTSQTTNQRRNQITTRLASIMRAVNDFKYTYSAASSGSGIGTTEEYFTNTYDIPSYTLELEPRNSAQDYGAIAGGHSGFILPNAEVARMRDEKDIALLVGLYAIAQVPYTTGIKIKNSETQSDEIVLEWRFNEGSGELVTITTGTLSPSTSYRLDIIFSKPMRWLKNGEVVDYSTISKAQDIELALLARSTAGESSWNIDSEKGEWLTEGYARYQTDTFSVPLELTSDFDWAELTYLALEVETNDFTGYKLDTNPATLADWGAGAWVNYEDTDGQTDTDSGGIDRSMRLIDDGSELYSAPTPEPAPEPSPPPPPPPAGDSGSGGSPLLLEIFILLGLALIRLGSHLSSVNHPNNNALFK
ncbi:M14 family zinc carboxypeptidase [Alteromonas ponticola]|uniref:Zinc carboxypeptidase n=1 Tax=Alteromonas ponticola TaxID=2720613 RepID=A0ABX1R1H1_9ALTE|nr:M14 family zinc carboxypeptidase [Alteromonas ponticola]NMH59098.1 zinc carboxypeptidase [Alteromonas ponticola]